MPASPTDPVRVTSAGAWFRPADGGAGSLVRLRDGVSGESVRRIRDLGVPGLLPIGNVVERDGVWLRTPQPPGPALDDLRTHPLGYPDAVAVLGTVGRTLRALHSRGLSHGHLAGDAVMLDPGGVPLLVMVEPGDGGPHRDADDLAELAWSLAATWGLSDGDAGAALLRRCADRAESAGIEAALDVLPRVPARPGAARLQVARAWSVLPVRSPPEAAQPPS